MLGEQPIRADRRSFLGPGLVAVSGHVLAAGSPWPAWVITWVLALVLGMTGKWLTWRGARDHRLLTPLIRTLGWFLLWPGLDGRAFFTRKGKAPRRKPLEWLAAVLKLVVGISFIWRFAPAVGVAHPLAAGWLAMIGMVLCLYGWVAIAAGVK